MSKTKTAPKKPRAQKSRERIVAYATRLFLERGFRKVTIDELCAGMAMSKRTFYKHFANRDELVEAIIEENMAEIAPAILGNLTSDKPIGEILTAHFNLLVEILSTRISTVMMADVQDLMPEVWEKIDSMRMGFVGMVAELIKRGQKDGTIREDLDPEVVGLLLQTTVNTLANPGFIMSHGLSTGQVGRTIKTLVIHGIFNPETQGRVPDRS